VTTFKNDQGGPRRPQEVSTATGMPPTSPSDIVLTLIYRANAAADRGKTKEARRALDHAERVVTTSRGGGAAYPHLAEAIAVAREKVEQLGKVAKDVSTPRSPSAIVLAELAQAESAAEDGDFETARRALRRARRVITREPGISEVTPDLVQTVTEAASALDKASQASRADVSRKNADERKYKYRSGRCVGCGASGLAVQLSLLSGRLRCKPCFRRWEHPTCTRCLKPFKRKQSSPRQRLCDACGGGRRRGPRTVSGGLPTLGRRR
jgi:hypothetical protein